MKKLTNSLFALIIVLGFISPITVRASDQNGVIPTFSVIGIIPDTSITILTYNFPAGKYFDVMMGYMGSRGVNGIKVATISSGGGGSFQVTVGIPQSLKGVYQIAVRMQSTTGGYYAYNWFYNSSWSGPGSPSVPGSSIVPHFVITGVVVDHTVSIQTYNFPGNDNFDVLMNYMGTRGVNGIKVAAVSSGSGGSLSFTFNIPAALMGLYQISIRLQSSTGSGYFAYNWFYNNTAGHAGGPGIPGYLGFPTFSISNVVKNTSVTIVTHNLPANDRFQVLMGPIGTRGINGVQVNIFDSGSGGVQTLTFNIPPEMHGAKKIAIRLQSVSGSGFYAYNWFYNKTTS